MHLLEKLMRLSLLKNHDCIAFEQIAQQTKLPAKTGPKVWEKSVIVKIAIFREIKSPA